MILSPVTIFLPSTPQPPHLAMWAAWIVLVDGDTLCEITSLVHLLLYCLLLAFPQILKRECTLLLCFDSSQLPSGYPEFKSLFLISRFQGVAVLQAKGIPGWVQKDSLCAFTGKRIEWGAASEKQSSGHWFLFPPPPFNPELGFIMVLIPTGVVGTPFVS